MFKDNTQIGYAYIGSSILFWSFFPIVSILAFASVPPLFTAGISTLIAGGAFLGALTLKKQLHFFKTCTVWAEIFLASILIGICYYGLMFYGISKTTAGNATIFSQFEVLFTFLILNTFLKHEPLIKNHVIGAFLMILGAVIILFPRDSGLTINLGDTIIILACLFPPFGNMYAQKALKQVSSTFLMAIRSFVAGTFFLVFSFFWEAPWPTWAEVQPSLPFLIINGLLLLGLAKIFFLEAIKRLPISQCISFGVAQPALTLVFAYFILTEIPTFWQLIGFIPIACGALLLLKKPSNSI